eukprot:97611_1
MGQCASFKDHHGNILGYILLNDMHQGTGYEYLAYFDRTQACLEDYASRGGTYNGVSSRYYMTHFPSGPNYMSSFPSNWGTYDGWCKSDPDAFFTEALYQENEATGSMQYCFVQGTGSQNIVK